MGLVTQGTMTLAEFMEKVPVISKWVGPIDGVSFVLRKGACCADGSYFSIQHSGSHHCNENSVEVCCDAEPMLKDYLECSVDLDCGDSVYGFVPLALMQRVVDKHGGIIGWTDE